MNLGLIISVFARDFRKQKKRITLTLVALSWGTISIMLLLGFGEGLHQQLSVNQRGMGEQIAVLWGGQTSKPYKGMGKGRPIRFLKEDVAYLQSRIPDLKNIGGEYHRWGVQLRYKDVVVSEHINGVYPNYEEMRNFIPLAGGRMINQTDMNLKRRTAFLGYELAKRLFGSLVPSELPKDEAKVRLSEAAVGKTILVNSMPFTVVGVMIDKMQMSSYEGNDQDLLAMPSTTFEALFGDPWLDNMVYQPRNARQMKDIEKQVYGALAAKYKFDPRDEPALSIWDTVEGMRELNNILFGIKIFLGIIGGLTLLIAGVGVANIMYVSIKERTREIGIKMAVGAKKAHVLWQFLLEALVITFTGGLLGMVVSYALTEGFKKVEIKSDVLDFMGRPTISWDIGITVVVILGIMGLISGLFPAMRASSVSPVESLRYE
ncbi:MAG: ABC transporter permease [Candidatus Zixiibacteriota bacterium]